MRAARSAPVRLRLATALAALPAAAACSGGGAPATATSSAAGSAPVSSGQPVRPLSLGLCIGVALSRARCGTLTVPLDYSDPARGTIGLRVISVGASDPARRIGALLVNPGGPGASGVQFVEEAYGQLFTTLNQRFDIVGFDPRGAADPNPVACEGTAGLDQLVALDPVLDDPHERDDTIAASRQLAQACERRSGELLPYVGTENAARDMETLRVALGGAPLNYLGFSYGSALGTAYAALFPTHVRAMVFDGVLDPAVDILDQSAQQADGFQRNYEEFLRECGPACPLGPDPGATIVRLLDDLDRNPVTAADGRSVGRGVALTALAGSMYDPTLWSALYTIWARAAGGDPSGLLLVADAYTGRQSTGYDHLIEDNTAITCVDQGAPSDFATLQARVGQVEARDPLFAGAAFYGSLPCAWWPVRGPQAAPVNITGPILLVGGTEDPATPYAWAQGLHREIQGSVLLTRVGFGHTSYGHSVCIAAHVDAYLFEGVLPPDGTTCSS